MKKQFPTPLYIFCDGLSRKLAAQLADLLCEHFELVEFDDNNLTIIAHKPLNNRHYDLAWRLLDKYCVKVS